MNSPAPIYLDNNSTTTPDPLVVSAMQQAFQVHYGNPSSAIHLHGQAAKELVQQATTQLASLAGCDPDEIIFTSGATESINTVLQGVTRQIPVQQLRILTCITEHSAVRDTCKHLETLGATIVQLPVEKDGSLSLSGFENAITQFQPHITSLMHANNEIGTIHPIKQIADICYHSKVLFHVDAAQTFGKLPINFHELNCDFLSLSGHKFYGPKGIGALLIRRRNPPIRLTPLIHGGGQQRGIRSGTLNVPGIVGMGMAAEICRENMTEESARIFGLTQSFLSLVQKTLPGISVNGPLTPRLPGNINISIPNINGLQLLPALKPQISVSSGSACTSRSTTPSYVLKAIGRTDEQAISSIRLGIGRFNTTQHIELAAQVIIESAHALEI